MNPARRARNTASKLRACRQNGSGRANPSGIQIKNGMRMMCLTTCTWFCSWQHAIYRNEKTSQEKPLNKPTMEIAEKVHCFMRDSSSFHFQLKAVMDAEQGGGGAPVLSWQQPP